MAEKKYLFVGEYCDSYTGGSVVFISTEEFLDQFEMNGLKIIRDSHQVQLRQVKRMFSYFGVPIEKFWERINAETFTDEFKTYLKEYPSNKWYLGNDRIRADWLPENEEGIYIVFKKEIDDLSDEIVIISDTYYCA
jgi:hypothetical protein